MESEASSMVDDDQPASYAHVFGHGLDHNGALDSVNYPNMSAPMDKLTNGSDTRWQAVCRMHKFRLYETTTRFFFVGGDIMDQRFRILKIDRTTDQGDLNIAEDDILYTRKEIDQILNAVDDGNKASGGLALKSSPWGLLGFIRFTGEYYMLLITKRSQVAVIGGHYVYQIDGTELVSLSSPRFKADRHPEEARFVSILNNLDLTRSFYFSYTYDISHTLQHNLRRERSSLKQNHTEQSQTRYNDMFIWNHHLLKPLQGLLKSTIDWCIPIVHGFVDQAGRQSPLPR